MPDYLFEDELAARHGGPIAGIDEAGRGPWAGPVVAAAAILDHQSLARDLVAEIDDSKKLSEARREVLAEALMQQASIGIGWAQVEEIDQINILQATFLAMTRALENLDRKPKAVLIDGNRGPHLALPSRCLVKGDARSLSIAAASICAKVARDRHMRALDALYPAFCWARNKGYGTRDHAAALTRLGVTPHHRRSFAPIRNILCRESQ